MSHPQFRVMSMSHRQSRAMSMSHWRCGNLIAVKVFCCDCPSEKAFLEISPKFLFKRCGTLFLCFSQKNLFPEIIARCISSRDIVPRCLYNSKLTQTASMLAHFDWAIYRFNSNHFLSTIKEHGYPFHVVLACNPFVNGRALFRELTLCSPIHSSAASLLNHVRALGITSKLTGYLIHSHCYCSSEPTKRFWELQCQIVKQL